jgi:crossover junction endodeoxyribonuclease RuvC
MPAVARMSRVVGIDPGLHGGLGVLDLDAAGELLGVAMLRTPVLMVTRGRKARDEYNPEAMRALLAATVDGRPPELRGVEVVLEAQGARPGQGTASSYKTGLGFGLWLGLVVAMRVPFRIVAPAVWKQHAGLIGADKRASRLRAQERFPSLGAIAAADEGPAEGLLMAAYVAAAKGTDHASSRVPRGRRAARNPDSVAPAPRGQTGGD